MRFWGNDSMDKYVSCKWRPEFGRPEPTYGRWVPWPTWKASTQQEGRVDSPGNVRYMNVWALESAGDAISVNKVESNPRRPNSDLWPAHTCSRTQENSNAHTTHTYTCKEKERECFTGNYKLSVVYAPQHMMEETMLLWTHNRPVIWMQRRQKKWRISQG